MTGRSTAALSALASALLLFAVHGGHAGEIYVAADGNDGWSGKLAAPNGDRTDGPLATLEGARDAVRQLARDGLKEPVRVQTA